METTLQETFTPMTAHAELERLSASGHLEHNDYVQLHEWNDDGAYAPNEIVRVARLGQLWCGHLATPRSGGLGTGYARRAEDDRRICYSCATEAAREDFRKVAPGGKFGGYYSNGFFTNWTGAGIGRGRNHANPNDDGRGMMLHAGKDHPWSRERFYVSARDCFGRDWHGTAGEGMYCILTQSINAPVLED